MQPSPLPTFYTPALSTPPNSTGSWRKEMEAAGCGKCRAGPEPPQVEMKSQAEWSCSSIGCWGKGEDKEGTTDPWL